METVVFAKSKDYLYHLYLDKTFTERQPFFGDPLFLPQNNSVWKNFFFNFDQKSVHFLKVLSFT